MSKTTQEEHWICFMQKKAQKTLKIKKMTSFFIIGKIGHSAWAIAFAIVRVIRYTH